MLQRKGRMLEIMEMERLRVRIFDLRVVMMVVADGDPDVFMALTAMLDVLASELEERLRTLHEWWGPRAPRKAGSLPWHRSCAQFKRNRPAQAVLLPQQAMAWS